MKLTRLTPWLPESMVQAINRRLVNIPNATILEFGMGMSTLYYVNRPGVQKIVSVEHDPQWYSQVVESVSAVNPGKLVPILAALPYAQSIATSTKIIGASFDMILIDGRNRSGCMRVAPELLNPGGFIVLDNSEREEYQPAIQRLMGKGFLATHHLQLLPDEWGFTYPGWQATLFEKK